MISPNEKFQKTISSSINERGGLKKPQKVLPKMVSSPEIDQMKILKKSNIELLDQTKIEEVFASHFILRSVDHNRRLSLIQQLILCEVEEKKIIFESCKTIVSFPFSSHYCLLSAKLQNKRDILSFVCKFFIKFVK